MFEMFNGRSFGTVEDHFSCPRLQGGFTPGTPVSTQQILKKIQQNNFAFF